MWGVKNNNVDPLVPPAKAVVIGLRPWWLPLPVRYRKT